MHITPQKPRNMRIKILIEIQSFHVYAARVNITCNQLVHDPTFAQIKWQLVSFKHPGEYVVIFAMASHRLGLHCLATSSSNGVHVGAGGGISVVTRRVEIKPLGTYIQINVRMVHL